MKKIYFVALSAILLCYISLTGFECASTELTSAKLYIQQKNYDKAIDVLEKETVKNPKGEEGHYLLGYVYGEKGEHAKMLKEFDAAVECGKKFEKDIKQARKSYWASNFNKGAGFFNKATQSKNDSSKVYYAKSADAFNLAIQLEPDSAETYKNLAYVYLNVNKYDDAIPVLNKWMSIKHDKDAYKLLGEIYVEKGNQAKEDKDTVKAMDYYNQAINLLEEGRKLHPGETEILEKLSNAYIAANKAEIAKSTFKDLVEKDPENKSYRYNYGVLLLGGNDYPGAETQFLEALKSDPEYYNAMYNLAVAYVKWGAILEKKAEDAGKNDPEAKVKYSAALPYLEAYVQKKADDIQVIELLGKVYLKLGQNTDAQKLFEKADALRKK